MLNTEASSTPTSSLMSPEIMPLSPTTVNAILAQEDLAGKEEEEEEEEKTEGEMVRSVVERPPAEAIEQGITNGQESRIERIPSVIRRNKSNLVQV